LIISWYGICDIVESKILRDGVVIKEFCEDANDKYIKEMEFFYDIMCQKKESTNSLSDAMDTMKIADEIKEVK